MSFANPIWFYAFAGLLIPVAIHLWNKKELKTIPVGSVLWFPKGSSQKSRSVKLRDIFLLFLRIVIISLLVFILVKPLVKSSKQATDKAVFIDPGLQPEDDERITLIIDSLVNNGYEKRWLSSGFPDHSEQKPEIIMDYWNLVEDLNNLNLTDVIVFTTNKLNRIEGIRPELTNNITLLAVDSDEDENKYVLETLSAEGNNYTIEGISKPSFTKFNKLKIKNVQNRGVEWLDSLKVKITANKEFESDAKYIQTAIQSIKQYTYWPIAITSSDTPDVVISLGESNLEDNAKHFILYNPSINDSYFKISVKANLHYLTRRIKADDRNLSRLPGELLKLIRSIKGSYSSVIETNDIRTIADSQVMPIKKEEQKAAVVLRYYNYYLFIILFAVLVLERLLSAKKGL